MRIRSLASEIRVKQPWEPDPFHGRSGPSLRLSRAEEDVAYDLSPEESHEGDRIDSRWAQVIDQIHLLNAAESLFIYTADRDKVLPDLSPNANLFPERSTIQTPFPCASSRPPFKLNDPLSKAIEIK